MPSYPIMQGVLLSEDICSWHSRIWVCHMVAPRLKKTDAHEVPSRWGISTYIGYWWMSHNGELLGTTSVAILCHCFAEQQHILPTVGTYAS